MKWPKYLQEWLIAQGNSDKTCNQFLLSYSNSFSSSSEILLWPLQFNPSFSIFYFNAQLIILNQPFTHIHPFPNKGGKSKTFWVGKITSSPSLIMSYSFLRPHLSTFSRSAGKRVWCQRTQPERTPRSEISQRPSTMGFHFFVDLMSNNCLFSVQHLSLPFHLKWIFTPDF